MLKQILEDIEKYLNHEITHDEMSERSWGYLEKENIKNSIKSHLLEIIHFADDIHWKDGITEREINRIKQEIKNSLTNESS